MIGRINNFGCVIKPEDRKERVVRLFHKNDVIGFPMAYVDRYTYIGDMLIRTSAELTPEEIIGGGSNTPFSMYIGAFNSISWDIKCIVNEDHDYKSVTTWNMGGGIITKDIPFKIRKKTSIVIQNDVWIGQAVTIYGGVTIHNGAVVAGNSVVTKDVPPYAIVGGNPARVIKYRFDEETIKKLLKIEWWYWREEYIKSNGKWFERDAKDFSDHFYPLMKNGNDSDKDELTSFVENNKKKYLFFADLDEVFGIWQRVISEFDSKFSKQKDAVLLIAVDSNKETAVLEQFLANKKLSRSVYIIKGSIDYLEKKLFPAVDYYITSRCSRTVRRTCLADKYNVPTLSGTDIPLFM